MAVSVQEHWWLWSHYVLPDCLRIQTDKVIVCTWWSTDDCEVIVCYLTVWEFRLTKSLYVTRRSTDDWEVIVCYLTENSEWWSHCILHDGPLMTMKSLYITWLSENSEWWSHCILHDGPRTLMTAVWWKYCMLHDYLGIQVNVVIYCML